MAKLRNIRERFETYILERTTDRPSVASVVNFENGQPLLSSGRLAVEQIREDQLSSQVPFS